MNETKRQALVDELAEAMKEADRKDAWYSTPHVNAMSRFRSRAQTCLPIIERLLATAPEPGLDELHQDVVVQRGCTKLMFFLSDYLEDSTGLAEAAIEGIMDYCKVVGSDTLAIDFSSSAPKWEEMSREEQNQLWTDAENLQRAVAQATGITPGDAREEGEG